MIPHVELFAFFYPLNRGQRGREGGLERHPLLVRSKAFLSEIGTSFFRCATTDKISDLSDFPIRYETLYIYNRYLVCTYARSCVCRKEPVDRPHYLLKRVPHQMEHMHVPYQMEQKPPDSVNEMDPVSQVFVCLLLLVLLAVLLANASESEMCMYVRYPMWGVWGSGWGRVLGCAADDIVGCWVCWLDQCLFACYIIWDM